MIVQIGIFVLKLLNLPFQFRYLFIFFLFDLIPAINDLIDLSQESVYFPRRYSLVLLFISGLSVSFNFWIDLKQKQTRQNLLTDCTVQFLFVLSLLFFALI